MIRFALNQRSTTWSRVVVSLIGLVVALLLLVAAVTVDVTPANVVAFCVAGVGMLWFTRRRSTR